MIIDSSSMACGMAYGTTSRSTVARSMVFVLFFLFGIVDVSGSYVSWRWRGIGRSGRGNGAARATRVAVAVERLGGSVGRAVVVLQAGC